MALADAYSRKFTVQVLELEDGIVNDLAEKVLTNYINWSKHVGQTPWIQNFNKADNQTKLLCVALYIWGEAANLRLMPECLYYILHNMLYELKAGRKPAYGGEEGSFLRDVVTPIYCIIAKISMLEIYAKDAYDLLTEVRMRVPSHQRKPLCIQDSVARRWFPSPFTTKRSLLKCSLWLKIKGFQATPK